MKRKRISTGFSIQWQAEGLNVHNTSNIFELFSDFCASNGKIDKQNVPR